MKTISALFSMFFCFFLSTAQAYDLESSSYLFGDWGGARTSLADQGMVFKLAYGSETAHNYSGGSKQMTAYTDQWVVGAGFDFEKLGFWKGGFAQVTMTDRNGQNLGGAAGIGNDMLIQEVYGRGQALHMTQFWFNQKFFDSQLEWKLGRLTVGEDFAAFSCDFMNLSFCGAQPGNIVGSYWLNWPDSVWATRVKWHSGEHTFWQIGAYQVNPTYVEDSYARKYGWTLDNPSGSNGTLIPLEFAWTPTVETHPGSYKFGAWYNTAKGADLSNPLQSSAQFGVYVNFEQQLTGTKDAPGLSVFLNVSQADRATAAVDRQISVGTQYHGPFERLRDVVGFALGATNNNPLYADYLVSTNTQPTPAIGGGNEYDCELYYSYSPIASLFLRPNVQYVLDPGGTSANKNAFILGLKTGVAF